jgi:hypothetical protein
MARKLVAAARPAPFGIRDETRHDERVRSTWEIAFLKDRSVRDRRWPLAKERRQHVHSMIDRFDLSVAHDTIRQGSPYVLMLEKQAILFTRDAKRREAEAEMLAWVERARAGVEGVGPAGTPAVRRRRRSSEAHGRASSPPRPRSRSRAAEQCAREGRC